MRIGIIICDRYKQCEGGKCFRAVENREGAFRRYSSEDKLTVVAYATCGGCPGGNVENTVSKMKNYGVQTIHFATGVLAGYPPCHYLDVLTKYTEEQTGLPVIIGTHPMPTNYISHHKAIGDWTEEHLEMMNKYELLIPGESEKYDSSLEGYSKVLQEEIDAK